MRSNRFAVLRNVRVYAFGNILKNSRNELISVSLIIQQNKQILINPFTEQKFCDIIKISNISAVLEAVYFGYVSEAYYPCGFGKI